MPSWPPFLTRGAHHLHYYPLFFRPLSRNLFALRRGGRSFRFSSRRTLILNYRLNPMICSRSLCIYMYKIITYNHPLIILSIWSFCLSFRARSLAFTVTFSLEFLPSSFFCTKHTHTHTYTHSFFLSPSHPLHSRLGH